MTFVTSDNLEYGRFALAVALVFANVAVWSGVYLEGDRFAESTKKIGWKILVIALAAEAAFAAILVVVDSEMSRRQKGEIIALETKLAPRTLSNEEAAQLAALLRQFGAQEFTIGSYGGEAASLAGRLKAVLEKADWKWFDPEYQIVPLAGTIGIQVWARSHGSREAAKPLVDALNGKLLEATLLPDQPNDPTNEKIEIIVGSKF